MEQGRESMNRRQALGALTAAAGLASTGSAAGDVPLRPLGKTGEKVACIGLGGAHIGRTDPTEATRLVRTAIDRGITFMDNCWDYSNGECERRMGVALRDGYRQKVFLMTKFDGRTKPVAAKQIDESLSRLQTDHIDLMQYHENIRMDDPDKFFAAGGPLEALMEAKKAGKIRYIGFTGHKDPSMHLRMLELAAQHKFHFDTCQMPLNLMDYHFRSFGHQVLPKLVDQGIAPLAMKTIGSGAIVRSGTVSAVDCLRYALNLPIAVAITGMDSMDRIDQAVEVARTFKPMSEGEVAALAAKTKEAALTGNFEQFKTSNRFDGTSRNPEWMG
jgi:aryl-alcohol dehydrogenase-like predicted oxidoreductase